VAFSDHLLDVAVAERKTKVLPHALLYHFDWKLVPTISILRTLTSSASHIIKLTMPASELFKTTTLKTFAYVLVFEGAKGALGAFLRQRQDVVRLYSSSPSSIPR
jgi:hypothetical protein